MCLKPVFPEKLLNLQKSIMKKILVSLACIVVTMCTLRAQSTFDTRVGEALNNSEWFELRDAYIEGKDSLSPMLKAFAESMLAYNFNRNDEACRAIERLVDNHQAEIGVGNVMSMLFMKAAALKRMGFYSEAAKLSDAVCKAFEPYSDSMSLAVYREFGKQYETLARYDGVNEMTISGDEGVASFRLDSIGRAGKRGVCMMLPSMVNGVAQDIVFDSGAGVNVVGVSAAKRLGLDIYDVGTRMTGFGTQQGGLAVAKEIVLGNITMKNVPFYVMDISSGVDSIDVYMKHLDMILGVEFIRSAKEFHIDFVRSAIVIPDETTSLAADELPNMCYGVNGLFGVEAEIEGIPRLIHLDTGAPSGGLTGRYYALYGDSIATHCVPDTVRMAGAGGVSIEKAYKLCDVTLSIGGVSCTFPTILVSTDGNSGVDLGYGNLGMDYFLQFDKVIYNTEKMFLKLIP